MKKGSDILRNLGGLMIIHQKIPSREVGRHKHSEHEIFLPLQGDIQISYEGKSISAGPGKMLYVPPDLDHSFSSSAQGSGERIIFLAEKRTWAKHISKNLGPLSLNAPSLAKELIFYLLIHPEHKGKTFFIQALLESLSEALEAEDKKKIELSHLSSKSSHPQIQKAFEIIQASESVLKISDLAKKSGLSQRNFNRLFLQEVGLSPKDYLYIQRMQKARALLEDSNLTVTEVSLEVGYNSLSKFIEAFKKMYAILPSDIKQHR